jgi:predicted MFS family arabinose efflux permease
VLGGAESFMISGVLNWGLALAGPSNTGKVMSWVGTAMYIAFAAGAPAGSVLYAHYSFVAVAAATTVVPSGTPVRRTAQPCVDIGAS